MKFDNQIWLISSSDSTLCLALLIWSPGPDGHRERLRHGRRREGLDPREVLALVRLDLGDPRISAVSLDKMCFEKMNIQKPPRKFKPNNSEFSKTL